MNNTVLKNNSCKSQIHEIPTMQYGLRYLIENIDEYLPYLFFSLNIYSKYNYRENYYYYTGDVEETIVELNNLELEIIEDSSKKWLLNNLITYKNLIHISERSHLNYERTTSVFNQMYYSNDHQRVIDLTIDCAVRPSGVDIKGQVKEYGLRLNVHLNLYVEQKNRIVYNHPDREEKTISLPIVMIPRKHLNHFLEKFN